MRGQILGVDVRTGEGQLTGDDGRRYRFKPDDWAHRGEPAIGITVDFEPEEDWARSIFPLPVAGQAGSLTVHAAPPPPAYAPAGHRNRVVAALLAFFLGLLGAHRFYTGRTGSAILMLVLTITVIGMIVTGPWAIIDTIRYLIMSDREFEDRYDRKV